MNPKEMQKKMAKGAGMPEMENIGQFAQGVMQPNQAQPQQRVGNPMLAIALAKALSKKR